MSVAAPRARATLAAPRPLGVAVFALVLIVAVLASTLYLTSTAAGPGYALRGAPLDDAWIHFVYARSIAQGQPFQYNPGQWETGSTSPLWALVLAPGLALGAPPVLVGKALGILFLAAASFAGWRLVSRCCGIGLGVVSAVALPLVPYFSFAAVSCTETPLFFFLLLLTMDLAVAGRWTWSGGVLGLTILARPEGTLLLPLLIAAMIVAHRRSSRGATVRRVHWTAGMFRIVLPALAVTSPWVAYCLWASGRPAPSTFYAKALWQGPLNLEQLRKIGGLIASQPFFGTSLDPAPLVALGSLVGTALWIAGLMRIARSDRPAALLLGLFPPLLIYALSVQLPVGALGPPDHPGSVRNFYYARYFLPALAPVVLAWIVGVGDVLRRLIDALRSRSRGASAWAGAAVATLLALPAVSAIHQHGILRRTYSWNCQNIEAMQVAAGKWIAANLPKDASVAATDAGAVRFFGERRTVDLVGLNSHRLLPILKAIRVAGRDPARETLLRQEFWRLESVDHVAILKGMHPWLLRDRGGRVLQTFRVERNTICGRPELIVATVAPIAAPATKQ